MISAGEVSFVRAVSSGDEINASAQRGQPEGRRRSYTSADVEIPILRNSLNGARTRDLGIQETTLYANLFSPRGDLLSPPKCL